MALSSLAQDDPAPVAVPPLMLLPPTPDPYADWEDVFHDEQHRMDHATDTGDSRPMATVRGDGHGVWDITIRMPGPARTLVVGDPMDPNQEDEGE